MENNNWYKLDNAAKIFPPTTTYYDPKIFRFSIILSEEVNPTNLKKALDITLDDFPIFNSVLKKGFFWYYLEKYDKKPPVMKEHKSPCERLDSPFLIEVSFYANKINLEVYHALSDGGGCIYFFKNLIFNYLKINYNLVSDEVLDTASFFEKESDSFDKYFNPNTKVRLKNNKRAFTLSGKWYPEGKIKIITGVINVSDLKSVTKKYNTTITGFLIAILLKSINETISIKDRKKDISITVPIDLRRHFKSKTTRNFFNVTNINYNFSKNSDELEEIIKSVNQDLKRSLDVDVLSAKMNRMINLEKFFLIRLVPVFLKNPILKLSYRITRKRQTTGLSNVGIIDFPEVTHKYIKDVMVINSTDGMELVISSFNNHISLSFSTHFIDSEIEKNFFRILREHGLDIEVYTNKVEGWD